MLFVLIWQLGHDTDEVPFLKHDLTPAMPPNLDALVGHHLNLGKAAAALGRKVELRFVPAYGISPANWST